MDYVWRVFFISGQPKEKEITCRAVIIRYCFFYQEWAEIRFVKTPSTPILFPAQFWCEPLSSERSIRNGSALVPDAVATGCRKLVSHQVISCVYIVFTIIKLEQHIMNLFFLLLLPLSFENICYNALTGTCVHQRGWNSGPSWIGAIICS